jgi:hypothetical protein
MLSIAMYEITLLFCFINAEAGVVVRGMVILKWIFKKCGWRVCTGLIWLREGTGG